MCPLQLDLLLLYFYIQQIICITHTNQSTYFFKDHFFCGAKRDRTANLRLARAALSQLSYSPLLKC